VFSISKIVSGGLNLLTYGPMENVAALAGTPVLVNLKPKDASDKKALNANLLNEKKGWAQLIRDSFAYGDIATIAGAIGWFFTNRLFKNEVGENGQETVSGLKLWVGRLFKILTFGGFTIARLAQHKNLHIKRALGEQEFRKAFLEAVEQKTGKRVFEKLDVNKLVQRANNSTLEYNDDQESEIKDLHQSDDFKRFFTGDAGVGKTAGAEEICGAYAARKQKEGHNNVIVEKIKFENLYDYFSKQSEGVNMASTLFGMFGGDEAQSAVEKARTAVEVDPLALMELTLHRINDRMEEARKKGEDLVIILDEIDTLFPIDKLKAGNYDPAKLRILVEMLKNLLDPSKPGKILCTSNQDIGFFERLPVDENVKKGLTGEGGRLRVIRRKIEAPDPKTQARIIAGFLLDKFPNTTQVFDDEICAAINGKDKKSARQALADLVHRRITSNTALGRLVGRDLYEAIYKELNNKYKGLKERAGTGEVVKVNIDMIHTALKGQLRSVSVGDGRSVQGDEVAEGLIEYLVDPNKPLFRQIATNYIEKTKELQGCTLIKLLETLFAGIYNVSQSPNGNYFLFPAETDPSKMPLVNGVHQLHCFRLVKPKDEPGNMNKWSVETCYRPLTQAELQSGQTVQQLVSSSLYDFERSNPLTGEEFYKQLTEKLLFTIEKVSDGGAKQESGGINLMNLAQSVLGVAKKFGFKGLG